VNKVNVLALGSVQPFSGCGTAAKIRRSLACLPADQVQFVVSACSQGRPPLKASDYLSADLVWAFIDDLDSLITVERLLESAKKPVMVSVFKTPDQMVSCDGEKKSRLNKRFTSVLSAAQSVFVNSEELLADLSKSAVQATMFRGTAQSSVQSKPTKGFDASTLNIGFCGNQANCRVTYQTLIDSLASVNFRVDGREVILSIFGQLANVNFTRCAGPIRMHYFGLLSQADLISKMGAVDIAYLPQPLDAQRAEEVRLFIPDKLFTYAESGRPVLLQSPYISAGADFIRHNPIGINCHSHETPDILASIHQLISDQSFLERYDAALKNVLCVELNSNVVLTKIEDLTGVSLLVSI
jgi:hypothetical protein